MRVSKVDSPFPPGRLDSRSVILVVDDVLVDNELDNDWYALPLHKQLGPSTPLARDSARLAAGPQVHWILTRTYPPGYP